MSARPDRARTAATQALVADLSARAEALRRLPPAHVPVTQTQWQAIIDEAGLPRRVGEMHRALVALVEHREAVGRDIGRRLIQGSRTCTALADDLASVLAELAIFKASCPEVVEMTERVARWLEQVAGWVAQGMDGPLTEAPRVEFGGVGVDDPVDAAFGVASHQLHDKKVALSDSRLLALYRDRLPELTRRCEQVVRSVSDPPVEPFGLLAPLLDLMQAPRPLLAWRAARQAHALLRRCADTDPERLRVVLLELRNRAPARAASEQRLNKAVKQRAEAGTHSEKALAGLSVYRVLLEGQLRPLGWVLLRLSGAEGSMPMVNELRERCSASDQPLLRAVAGVVLPELRNADAHEEAHFDEISGELVLEGGKLVRPGQVAASEQEVRSLVAGLELALACAVAQLEPAAAAYALRPGDPNTAAEALKHVAQRYGHAGLSLWSIHRDRSTVHVVLDELGPLSPNPCFVATMQGHGLLGGVTRWQISLKGREGVVIDLSAQVLRENLPVFLRAANWFDRMPVGTFLPCNTWTRLAVETPGQAMRAAAWWALNEVQDAIDQAEESGDFNPKLFERRILNVMAAVAATLRLLPPYDSEPLERAMDVIRQLRFSLTGMALGPSLPTLIARVIVERDLFAVPSALPTLDARPIDVVEAELLGEHVHPTRPPHQLVNQRTGDPLGGVWRAPKAG